MFKLIYTGLIASCTLLISCSGSIQKEELTGRWNYVKVDNADPRDTLQEGELELMSPAIIFTKDDSLIIEWGAKKLSSGKFRMDGKMIRYTEDLANKQKREFPFLIKSLDKNELIFQTMENNTTTVIAKKAK